MPGIEIMLFAGAPGSGKSEIAKKIVSMELLSQGAQHLSIGDLKRSVLSGERSSKWAELLQQKAHPDRKTGAAPSEAMTGIMEEFILERPEALTIVDGFPRYADRIEPFKESMINIGASVIGLCVVETDETTLRDRLAARAPRRDQELGSAEFVEERLADHRDNILPTISSLSEDYPTLILDGGLQLDYNAQLVHNFYQELRA